MLRTLLVIAFFLVVLLPAVTSAQATRTWVSGVGDDTNPCSRTAPCKTFAGAITKTATGGEINCLDSGGFGSVTITKSMTIDCKGVVGGILASQTNGIIINLITTPDPAKTVRVRGLNINGAGNGSNGLRILTTSKVFVEDSVIDGFIQNGISVENASEVKLIVSNTSIRNVVGSGVNGASSGVSDITVTGSLLAGNGVGITAAGANTVFRLSENSIVSNSTGLSIPTGGGKIISYKNNLIDGNRTNGTPTSTISLQ